MILDSIQESLRNDPRFRKYTPEEIEVSRRAVMERSYHGPCRWDCPICGGAGYISNGVADIYSPEFGKTTLCPNADLFRLPGAAYYGLEPEQIKKLDWHKVKYIGAAHEAMKRVRETLDRGYGWVFLWGDVGNAKTLLLQVAVAESLRARKTANYTRMEEIMDDLRGAYDTSNPSQESEKRLEHWCQVPILAIDEVSRINDTSFASSRKFLIFDRRYQDAIRQKPSVTLFASNEPPTRFEPYFRDRIEDGRFTIVRLTGPSARSGMSREQDY